MADENLSGVPPSVTLSGLNAGEPSIGGTATPGISGAPGQSNGLMPGMEGGLDLASLLQILQAGDTSGIGSPGSMSQSLAAGSFGQQQGGLGAQSFGQTQPGYVAGQSSAGSNPALQAAAGSIDPASIIQKFLGVAAQGSRAVQNALTASPTAGSDLTLNTSLGGESGTGSPSIGTASPTIAQDQQGMLGNVFLNDPTISNLFTTGKLSGWDGSAESLNQLMASDPGIRDAFLQGSVGGSLGEELGAGSGGAGGFTLGTGGNAPGIGTSDILGGGLGTLQGLMSLYQGGKSGNVGSLLGGAGGTLSGINALAPGMGLGEAGQALGLAGGAFNAPFAALSLAKSIENGDAGGIAQGLANLYGTTVPVINAVFGTSLPTLTSIAGSALTSLGSTIGGTAGSAIGSVGSLLGGGAAAGAGAGAGAAGAAGAEAGLAGAGAGLGAGAGIGLAASPVLAAILAFGISNMLDPGSAPDISDLWTGGKIDPYLGFNKGLLGNESQQGKAFSTLEQGLPYVQSKEELGQLLNTYKNYLGTTTGLSLEDKSGVGDPYVLTAIPGTGPVTHGMQTPSYDWSGRQTGLQNQINALLNVLPGNRITDLNSGANGEAGMRLWTQFLDREKNAPAYVPKDVAPTAGVQVGEGETPGLPGLSAGFYGAGDLAQYGGTGATGGLLYGNPGYDYAGSGFPEPGKYLGSVSPYWQQLMGGQPAAASAMNPQLMVQLMAGANSPQASTAGSAMANGTSPYNADGRLTEETLMDILRRMSPGAAYAGV